MPSWAKFNFAWPNLGNSAQYIEHTVSLLLNLVDRDEIGDACDEHNTTLSQ